MYIGETITSRCGVYFFLAIDRISKKSRAKMKQKLKLLKAFLR